jgi:hypothetical protein
VEVIMADDTQRQPLRRTIRGGRPFFFDDPAIDKVLNMVVTLASEVWALRERVAAMEGIGVRQGALSPGEVDDYEFTPEQEQRMGADRKEFIDNLFRVLQESVEAAVANSPKAQETLERRPGVFGARISSVASKPAKAGGKPTKRRAAGKSRPAAARKPAPKRAAKRRG